MDNNESNVYMAKLSEQAERYEEMVEYMKSVSQETELDLSLEERNLLSVAYKNVVGARRASLRIIASILEKEKTKGGDKQEGYISQIEEYYKKVMAELNVICNDILDLLITKLLVKAETSEAKVFYQKMMADYYRYLAEFAKDSNKVEHASKAQDAYKSATAQSNDLPPTHPIRLGLALNYSVFLYEVQSETEDACKLAKQAFDDAIAELDTLDEESYKDSTLIMQLLRDNLTLWTSSDNE